jgi:CheY-specific phosphatase CheX
MTPIPEEDILAITESIWSAMVGLSVDRVDPDVVRQRAGTTFAGCVHVTGAWKGAIALHCSESLARRVAAAIFDVDAAVATISQTQDAVGELVNMTGGNLKALLPEPSQLSLPTVAQGRDFTARVPGSRMTGQMAFECQGEPLLVTVLERDESIPLLRRPSS